MSAAIKIVSRYRNSESDPQTINSGFGITKNNFAITGNEILQSCIGIFSHITNLSYVTFILVYDSKNINKSSFTISLFKIENSKISKAVSDQGPVKVFPTRMLGFFFLIMLI